MKNVVCLFCAIQLSLVTITESAIAKPKPTPSATEAKNTDTTKVSCLQGTWPNASPKISLELEKESIDEALEKLARLAGWGLVLRVPEDWLEEEITVRFQNKPAKGVLEALLQVSDLQAEWNNGMVVVTPGKLHHENVEGLINTPVGDVEFRVRHDGHFDKRKLKKMKHWKMHEHEGDRSALGGNLHVLSNEIVEGDAVAVGGSVKVDGQVEGDAVAVGGTVELSPGALVEGDAVAIGGRVIVPQGATVEGDRVSIAGSLGGVVAGLVSAGHEGFFAIPLAFSLFGSMVRAVALLVLGLLLVTFMPERMERMKAFLVKQPGRSTLGGLGLLVGFVPLCILLGLTLIGIPLIPLAVIALFFTLAVGLSAFCTWLGYRIPLFQKNKTAVGALLLGVLVLMLVDLIPILGSMVILVISFVSAGAVLFSGFGSNGSNGTTGQETDQSTQQAIAAP